MIFWKKKKITQRCSAQDASTRLIQKAQDDLSRQIEIAETVKNDLLESLIERKIKREKDHG